MSLEIRIGDLFDTDVEQICHCVSEDYHMNAGIARKFRTKFGNVNVLKNQKVGIGGCSVLRVEDRTIYYLVTKSKYYEKPTYSSVRKSLISMRILMETKNHTEIAMPLIGCGLDKLKWSSVSKIITDVLIKNGIDVIVYKLGKK